jgi:hypothetical protein
MLDDAPLYVLQLLKIQQYLVTGYLGDGGRG